MFPKGMAMDGAGRHRRSVSEKAASDGASPGGRSADRSIPRQSTLGCAWRSRLCFRASGFRGWRGAMTNCRY